MAKRCAAPACGDMLKPDEEACWRECNAGLVDVPDTEGGGGDGVKPADDPCGLKLDWRLGNVVAGSLPAQPTTAADMIRIRQNHAPGYVPISHDEATCPFCKPYDPMAATAFFQELVDAADRVDARLEAAAQATEFVRLQEAWGPWGYRRKIGNAGWEVEVPASSPPPIFIYPKPECFAPADQTHRPDWAGYRQEPDSDHVTITTKLWDDLKSLAQAASRFAVDVSPSNDQALYEAVKRLRSDPDSNDALFKD